MFRSGALLLVAVAALLAAGCPPSKSHIHAGCEVTVTFSDNCTTVQREMLGRINGVDGWYDPHNRGKYEATSVGAAVIEAKRVTGNGKYTDLLEFKFQNATSGGCVVDACSASQVFSIIDYSTNYCNLHDLYCSDSGCHPIFSHLKYTESFGKCSAHDASECLVV
eukprot:m.190746 g.190746  ORF g.190746 m.190746 type:complete len:165 (-) comp10588_c0_seq1:1176-1670(-)